MPVTGQHAAVPADALDRLQRVVAAELWHYTTAPVAKRYYVRGCIPDLDEATVTVGLWAGPSAREKTNLFLSVPLVADGRPPAATQVVVGLLGLGRGTHLFGFTGRRFDGKRVFDGSRLVVRGPTRPLPAETAGRQGPRGFYFQRPGQLKRY
ncbi:hypothetical protein [Streptomyces sp. BH105]|uniref:hypothetical protein n=1 Tax=Streptomyces sp. BH105 TaxID=3410408 RepID=UPI003CED1946